jgi:hypothetical protein
MMTSRSLICLLENQNGGKLQKVTLLSRKIIEIADLNRILIRMCAFRN